MEKILESLLQIPCSWSKEFFILMTELTADICICLLLWSALDFSFGEWQLVEDKLEACSTYFFRNEPIAWSIICPQQKPSYQYTLPWLFSLSCLPYLILLSLVFPTITSEINYMHVGSCITFTNEKAWLPNSMKRKFKHFLIPVTKIQGASWTSKNHKAILWVNVCDLKTYVLLPCLQGDSR